MGLNMFWEEYLDKHLRVKKQTLIGYISADGISGGSNLLYQTSVLMSGVQNLGLVVGPFFPFLPHTPETSL